MIAEIILFMLFAGVDNIAGLSCRDGWHNYNDEKCFKGFIRDVTWDEATIMFVVSTRFACGRPRNRSPYCPNFLVTFLQVFAWNTKKMYRFFFINTHFVLINYYNDSSISPLIHYALILSYSQIMNNNFYLEYA